MAGTRALRALIATAIALLTLLVPGAATAAPGSTVEAAVLGDGSTSDPNVRFVGRWDTAVAGAYVPSWAGGYIETAFTGTTVKIRQRNAVNIYAKIDNGPFTFFSGSGTINLTPTPLANTTHTLKVSYRSGDTVYQGLTFDSGKGTVASTPSPRLIEFVGDSITLGSLSSKLAVSSYGYVLGEQLGVRHTTIARAGYCLVPAGSCVGQRTQFFRLGSTGTTAWDFSRYQASAVVINLGTNDVGQGTTGATFQSNYTAFLQEIRAKYPNAAIIALQTLKQRYVPETQAAVNARRAAGDSKVHFVSTTGWLTAGTDYADGDGHPNDQGHATIANRLAPIIRPLIGL